METLAVFLMSCSNKLLQTIIHEEIIKRDSFIIPLRNALERKKISLMRNGAWIGVVCVFRWLQLNNIKTDWVIDFNTTLMQANLISSTFVRKVQVQWSSLTEIQPSLSDFVAFINSCKMLQSLQVMKCSVICDSLRGKLDVNILQRISKLILQDCDQKVLTGKLIRYFSSHCRNLREFVLTYHIRTSVFVGDDDGPEIMRLIKNNPYLHTIQLFTSGVYGDELLNRLLEAPRPKFLQDVILTFGCYRIINTGLIASILVECDNLRRFMVYSEHFFAEKDEEQLSYFTDLKGSGTKHLRIHSRIHNRWSTAAKLRLFSNTREYHSITLTDVYLTDDIIRCIAENNSSLSSFRFTFKWHNVSPDVPRISTESFGFLLEQCPDLQSKCGGTFEINGKLFEGM